MRKSLFTYLMIILFLQSISMVSPSSCSQNDESSPVSAKLLSTTTAVGGQDSIILAIELMIAKGWKVYAFNNNDALQAGNPTLIWHRQATVKTITAQWPQSLVIRDHDKIQNIYQHYALIPLIVDIQQPDQPFHLQGIIKLLACNRQCIPLELPLNIELTKEIGKPTVHVAKILAAQLGKTVNNGDEFFAASLIGMLLIAVAGGFILNFMPCVLPVLSLKLRNFRQQSSIIANDLDVNQHDQRRSYKINLLATIAGIMTSFLSLAFIAIAVQKSGHVFGWGMHFQQPLFITFMAIMLTIFTANLWGYCDIRLPNVIQNFMTKWLNKSSHDSAQNAQIIDGFTSGMLATLLATPCSAPFLGTALGYALSTGKMEIILIFLALGIGLSLPYFLALFIPVKPWLLPKPGRWMLWLNKILGISLVLTIVWLLWILGTIISSPVALINGLLLVSIIVIFKTTKPTQLLRKFIVVIMLAAVGITLWGQFNNDQKISALGRNHWQSFHEDKISKALEAGQVIFVDVTASWCTTCQLNKMLVLETEFMDEILSAPDIVALRADWTTHDPHIGHYLAQFKRYGIPCNIVYGPKAPQGIVLPELLDKTSVMQALEDAGYDYEP